MESSEIPKDNNCAIVFFCIGQHNCVYNIKKTCKHYNVETKECKSVVAQVNRLLMHSKHIGLELVANGFNTKKD